MLYYAAKTYKKSVEAKPELIAHVFVDYKERLEHGQKSYPIFLEVYNDIVNFKSNSSFDSIIKTIVIA